MCAEDEIGFGAFDYTLSNDKSGALRFQLVRFAPNLFDCFAVFGSRFNLWRLADAAKRVMRKSLGFETGFASGGAN